MQPPPTYEDLRSYYEQFETESDKQKKNNTFDEYIYCIQLLDIAGRLEKMARERYSGSHDKK